MQLYTPRVGGKIILKCIFTEDLDHMVRIPLAQDGVYYVFCENDNEYSSSVKKTGILCLTTYIFQNSTAVG